MKRLSLDILWYKGLALLLLALVPLALKAQEFDDDYSKRIICYLADESLAGRAPATEGSRMAREFIVAEMERAGLQVELQGDEYINVIGRLKGLDTTSLIIVGAHYDHHGIRVVKGSSDTIPRIHPGADDNASGVAALLQLARAFGKSETPLKYTVLFCAWDGEERGMKGSYDFAQKRVANPEEVALYMNFDMVGRTKDPANPAVTFAWDGHCDNLVQLCRECAERIEQPFVVLYDKRMEYGKGGSDYAPFSALKIPFIAWMEDEMHADYHKPTDTPDKICWEKLRKTTELAYFILAEYLY